jgi:SAM-dependent methyltransferase
MALHGAKALLNGLHERAVFNRRAAVLSRLLAQMIPGSGSVLDVGCGDGRIAAELMEKRPDLGVEGVDVLVRPVTHIRVTRYDGAVLPYADASVDYVTMVDVLHHTDDPVAVLRQAARVARRGIVIKDHLREGILAAPTLRLMDWVGNRGHDVRLPYNYLTRAQWRDAFAAAGLDAVTWHEKLGLYGPVFAPFFERRLHFACLLRGIQPLSG